jgi:3-hydroxyisobutyrate dehydrogenase-like beta-hydroxyacid dehydrogenase
MSEPVANEAEATAPRRCVAFVGLGVMGFPMAGHLAKAGFPTRVFNRSTERGAAWSILHDGYVADSPADAASGADIVFICVGNDDDVRSVAYGPTGALQAMKPGATLVDHTSASAGLARELAVAAWEAWCGFLDAPVSGGQAGAEQAKLTVMVGGDVATFEAVRPVIESYAHCVELIGPHGSGQLAKMVNQICVAGLIEGLAEGLHFGRAAGLDVAKVVRVISRGAAQSWQMENRALTMLGGEFEFGFAVDLMRKDLAIAFEEAARSGAELPITRLVDGFYSEVQAMGGGRWDTSSLMARLERRSRPKKDGG